MDLYDPLVLGLQIEVGEPLCRRRDWRTFSVMMTVFLETALLEKGAACSDLGRKLSLIKIHSMRRIGKLKDEIFNYEPDRDLTEWPKATSHAGHYEAVATS